MRFDLSLALNWRGEYSEDRARAALLLAFDGIPNHELAEFTGYSARQISAFRSGSKPVPMMLWRICQTLLHGMPPICGPLSGWKISKDELESPNGIRVPRRALEEWPEIAHRASDYHRLADLCRRQADHLEKLEQENRWLRKQVALDSKLGLMFRRFG